MTFDPTTVALVLVGDFGEGLIDLARTRQVWVADTPANRRYVMKVWMKDRPSGSENSATFNWSGDAAAELPQRIRDVDLHHGLMSQAPPYSRLEVYGCGATRQALCVLDELGFAVVDQSASGFVAERRVQ